MTFGEALELLKDGKRISRKNWNGKKQFIELASMISYVNAQGNIINAEHETMGNSAIVFHGTSGVQVGWLVSQADILSEDWYEVK